MQIKFKKGSRGNDLVIVVFEPDSNFNSFDLTWAPTLPEISSIYRALKQAKAYK